MIFRTFKFDSPPRDSELLMSAAAGNMALPMNMPFMPSAALLATHSLSSSASAAELTLTATNAAQMAEMVKAAREMYIGNIPPGVRM
jgi:hypothetical protein